jgi:hypothetical protein
MSAKPIDLTRGGRTERFYSPYDNEVALGILEGMMQTRVVCSPFAAEIARTCRAGRADAQKWAWVHRIIIDHENSKAPPPRQPVPTPPQRATNLLTGKPESLGIDGATAAPPPRNAAGRERIASKPLSEDEIRAYVKALLRTLQVAELRRLADDCFISTTDPGQTANWQAVGRELERLYPTTQRRKYLVGPEDEAWARGLIAAFGGEGALEAVLDVQRDVSTDQLAKWGRVETAIRRLNEFNHDKPRKVLTDEGLKAIVERPSRGNLKAYRKRTKTKTG